MSEPNNDEKKFKASPHKLKKAREKGQVDSSQDFVSCVALVAGAIATLMQLPALIQSVSGAFGLILSLAQKPGPRTLEVATGMVLWPLFEPISLILVAVVGASILANVAHKGGLIVAFKQIAPDLSRLDPAKGFGNMFGAKSMTQLGAAVLHTMVWFVICGLLVTVYIQDILASSICGGGCVVNVGYTVLGWLIGFGLIALVVVAALDLPLQKFLFLREMRMTRHEMKEEMKETEGSPEVLRARREGFQTAARLGLTRASFVLAGVEIAFAIRFHRVDAPVPYVVALARGPGAAALLARAREIGVPVETDVPLTGRLATTTRLGDNIPETEFAAVAPYVVHFAAIERPGRAKPPITPARPARRLDR